MNLTPSLEIIQLKATTSTMEVAREQFNGQRYGLVLAESQLGGRGTRGRTWNSPPGNLYLTVTFPLTNLPDNRMKLFSLESGLCLLQAIENQLPPTASMALAIKWPNDILLNEKKVGGLLLEVYGGRMLVGAGVNIESPPTLSDGGRETIGLNSLGLTMKNALAIATDFAHQLVDALVSDWSEQEGRKLLDTWRTRALWNTKLKLRDREGQPEVEPYSVTPDGHLKVRHSNGSEEVLVADYLL